MLYHKFILFYVQEELHSNRYTAAENLRPSPKQTSNPSCNKTFFAIKSCEDRPPIRLTIEISHKYNIPRRSPTQNYHEPGIFQSSKSASISATSSPSWNPGGSGCGLSGSASLSSTRSIPGGSGCGLSGSASLSSTRSIPGGRGCGLRGSASLSST